MSEERSRNVSITTTEVADPIPRRPTYSTTLGDCGVMRLHCANMIMIGTLGTNAGPQMVSIVVGQQACTCGCAQPGRALEYIPTPDQARMLARQLIDAADETDAHAAAQAGTLLDRVRKASGR